MNIVQKLLTAIALTLFASATFAQTFVYDANGQLSAINKLNADGALFDVNFKDTGSFCLVGQCNADTEFFPASVVTSVGREISRLLPGHAPAGMVGCTWDFPECWVMLPHQWYFGYYRGATIYFDNVTSHSECCGIFFGGWYGTAGDIPGTDESSNYVTTALISPSAVPEPSAVLLLLSGIALVGLAKASVRRA